MALSLQGLSPLSLHSRNYIYSDSLVFVSFHKSLQFSPAKTLELWLRVSEYLFSFTVRFLAYGVCFVLGDLQVGYYFLGVFDLLRWCLSWPWICFNESYTVIFVSDVSLFFAAFVFVALHCCSCFFIYVTWLCFNTDYLNLVFFLFWFFLGTLYYFLG